MSFLNSSRNRTFLTIIIAAFLLSAALAGGNWELGFADTTPTIPIPISIDPDIVHVNSVGFTATISGSEFVGMDYTRVFFQEPDGTEHEFLPLTVTGCDPLNEYNCSIITVFFPDSLFLNVGVAKIWVVNYDEFGVITGTSTTTIDLSIIDELYLPIIMKNS